MKDRIKAAIAALLVQSLIIYALIVGLGVPIVPVASETLTLIALLPDKPRPPFRKTIAPKARSRKPEAVAAPPNIRSTATQLVAPPPILPVTPPLLIAATVAGTGSQSTQGAANIVGSGTGAGGDGNGTGGGGRGNGSDNETPPRWLKGRLKDSDYPRNAGDTGAQGRVEVRFTVEINGRVDQCVIRRSSGNMDLDATTCRLIERRYRYRPARDAAGNTVRAFVIEEHNWAIESAPDS